MFLVIASGMSLVGLRGNVMLAQQTPARTPTVTVVPTSTIRLSGAADSNSPAIWELVFGRPTLYVLTSVNGQTRRASGSDVSRLGPAVPVTLDPHPRDGVWMEAIVTDTNGTWYGYYHNEIAANDLCRGTNKVLPRIGAARSTNRGRTWENLGIILEAPLGTHDCGTPNRYFVGGVGDFSVMLDPDSRDLYIFFTEYLRQPQMQGVAVARLAWANRDAPVGAVAVWRDGVWLPPRRILQPDPNGGAPRLRFFYWAGTPIYPALDSWHDNNPVVDAFWGPSVHWNTHLQQYVMLLNRARDPQWRQEGIYAAFAPRLDDPHLWSAPRKLVIVNDGSWYPQVMGLEAQSGTDKAAGEWARLFIGGESRYLLRFVK